jgi:hypothetical protein
MNDEMVKRLRLWAENMHGQKSSVIAVVMAEAADEIERLRKERDEARRMWCEAAPVGNSLSVDDMDRRARAEAKRRGWDCFKEKA